MWNEKTKPLVETGKLVVIGVAQEQHAERAQLYKQWKQYKFPIAQDSVTGLGLAVVPVPILLDEFGYVLNARPRISQIELLVNTKVERPTIPAPTLDPVQVDSTWQVLNDAKTNSSESSMSAGDALLRAGNFESTRAAIKCYQAAIERAVTAKSTELQGSGLFRLGVAYRTLFDLTNDDGQDPEDFRNAAKAWSAALELNPNQYIWRRRIQQYGPRQIKPYPFYDWVDEAIQEVAARGEVPIKLTVPLSKAEIAQPKRGFESAQGAVSPDPDARIKLDVENVVGFHATVVPQKIKPSQAVRVHLRFEPSGGHWNNEADPLEVWVEQNDSGSVSQQRLVHAGQQKPSSDEPRTLEFEFQSDAALKPGTVPLKGYALYYVCTTEDGQCLYRRQNFVVQVVVGE